MAARVGFDHATLRTQSTKPHHGATTPHIKKNVHFDSSSVLQSFPTFFSGCSYVLPSFPQCPSSFLSFCPSIPHHLSLRPSVRPPVLCPLLCRCLRFLSFCLSTSPSFFTPSLPSFLCPSVCPLVLRSSLRRYLRFFVCPLVLRSSLRRCLRFFVLLSVH